MLNLVFSPVLTIVFSVLEKLKLHFLQNALNAC